MLMPARPSALLTWPAWAVRRDGWFWKRARGVVSCGPGQLQRARINGRQNQTGRNRLPLHRQADAAQGGCAAHYRQGAIHRRFQSRRPNLCGDGAFAVSACAHRRDRCRGGENDARRARRVHRRRLLSRQARADPARSGAEDQIRYEAHRAQWRRGVHRAQCVAAGRQGAACRRSGRHGGGGDQGASLGCRRGGRGDLRGIAVRPAFRGCDAARRAGAVGRGAEQRHGGDRVRQCRGDRSGVRARRACGDEEFSYRQSHRRAARAARGARPLRYGDRPLHALCRLRRRGAAEERAGAGARHRAGKLARAFARCRRQFRHPQPHLRRVRPGAVGARKRSAGR